MARPRSRRLATALVLVAIAPVAVWALARWTWENTPIRAAERALDEGDLAGAGEILRRLRKEDPRQARAQLLHARLLRLSGRTIEADVALRRARDWGAPAADVGREYGLLAAGSDFRRAEGLLRQAVRERPADVEVLRALAIGLAGEKVWAEAADFYARWLRLEPGRQDAQRGRSLALVSSGRSPEAVSELRAILARRPDDPETRLLLADCFLTEGNMTAAEPELLACLRLRPGLPGPLIGLAGCALERGDLDRARALLDQAIALDPSSIAALTHRGTIALRQRRHDAALVDFESVVRLDPRNTQGHLNLAHLYRRAGDAPRAEEHDRIYRDLYRENAR